MGASQVAQMVKNLPAMQETHVRSLGQEDPLKKGMATHSSVLAWRIPWTEEPGGPQSMGHKAWDMTEQLTHTRSNGTCWQIANLNKKKKELYSKRPYFWHLFNRSVVSLFSRARADLERLRDK